ncbi:MAG: hypothetical protein ACLRIS_12840 [Flavonifractor plautii]
MRTWRASSPPPTASWWPGRSGRGDPRPRGAHPPEEDDQATIRAGLPVITATQMLDP